MSPKGMDISRHMTMLLTQNTNDRAAEPRRLECVYLLDFVATFIDVLAYQMVLLGRLFCKDLKSILAVCRGLSCPTT